MPRGDVEKIEVTGVIVNPARQTRLPDLPTFILR